MSFADLPEETDAAKILAALDQLSERIDAHAEAINGLGMNVQWIVDNAKGLFQMFGDPKFMQMLPNMMNPAGMMQAAKEMEAGNDGSADTAAGE